MVCIIGMAVSQKQLVEKENYFLLQQLKQIAFCDKLVFLQNLKKNV